MQSLEAPISNWMGGTIYRMWLESRWWWWCLWSQDWRMCRRHPEHLLYLLRPQRQVYRACVAELKGKLHWNRRGLAERIPDFGRGIEGERVWGVETGKSTQDRTIPSKHPPRFRFPGSVVGASSSTATCHPPKSAYGATNQKDFCLLLYRVWCYAQYPERQRVWLG